MFENQPPKICIIGAGAMGGFLGTHLAQGFADVSVLARGATLNALRHKGWTLEAQGRRISASVKAVSDSTQLGIQDVVILSVKAHTLTDILPHIQPLLGAHTLVVPVLNGVPWWFTLSDDDPLNRVDPHGAIAAAIPHRQVIGAVAYPACSCPEPGVVKLNSGSRLVFGELSALEEGAFSPRLMAFVSLLKTAGLEAEASSDIRTEVWKKLLGNACFNPISFITGTATDLLIDDMDIYQLFQSMMSETQSVGLSLGIQTGINVTDRIAVTRKLGHVKTSMLQDAEAGRAIEIDAILGAVVELGKINGVPTPTLDMVLALTVMRAKTFGLLKA